MDKKTLKNKLPLSYYLNSDVVYLAKDLIGKILFTCINNTLTAGIITETEAYAGTTDKACHAYGNKYTKRTQIMYEKGGVGYVYLCYGLHYLFNIITNQKGIPDAVLIRGIFPIYGLDDMLKRAGKAKFTDKDGLGPGKVSKLLGINMSHNGIALNSQTVWVCNSQLNREKLQIQVGKRIGIAYAEEDALLPYRFTIQNYKYLKSQSINLSNL